MGGGSMTAALEALVRHARRCAFYRELYAESPEVVRSLAELPRVEQGAYWSAYRAARERVLCGEHVDGLMLSSGGTTGAPKRTHVSQNEWTKIAVAGSEALLSAGLELGDRVGNLCTAGDLATSMLFIHASVLHARVPMLELPLGSALPPETLAERIHELSVHALVGTPSVLSRVLEAYARQRGAGPKSLRKLLFLGEMLAKDQADQMRAWVPGLAIASAGHSMVDIGLVGVADPSCALGEHRELSECVRLEIVDPETGAVIDEPGQPGELLVTSLVRRLQPMIRYQVGDQAMWVEPPGPGRKYQLLGRAPAFWSLSAGSYTFADVERVVAEAGVRTAALQLHVSREGDRERLVIKLVPARGQVESAELGARVVELLLARLRWIRRDIAAGLVAPVTVEWCVPGDLTLSARAGKTLLVVDTR
ncbi:hypothetical protein PPSIR1_41349 [Plesiocystis pacifica SIR-1]|uniref:AMP-dependent synthetase/ligase domain-containing protein n=2 Tax=Plesiocystis pacifica TaxID=191768 RepID=A6GDF8_9BACT|nr:hypothetical protein PPSIR1_41349 [Plesiocystis pacifica SIR-1]